MSRPQPRPGVQRKPAGGPPSQAGNSRQRSNMPSLEELRGLPAFVEEGENIDLDPANASTGKMTDETATIAAAKFYIQDWKRKDGSYPETAVPEVQLLVSFKRDGDEDGDRFYQEQYKYANVSLFAPTKDGNFVKVRPNVVKEGSPAPKPRKTASGVAFLQSIKVAGGDAIVAKLNKEGVKALVGLRVHVRLQRVPGSHENAKDALLVDYIGDDAAPKTQAAAPARAAAKTEAKPAAKEAPVVQQEVADTAVDSVSELATQALVEILTAAAGNTIARAQIPTTLIRIEQWKTHDQRGAILKRLREDDFINGSDQWIVDGSNVILA